MQRETKVIKLGKHEVEVKTYITGGENREIEDIYLKDMQVSVDGEGNTVIPGIDAKLAREAQNKTFEIMVLKVDGNSENILEAVLALPKEDYDNLVLELNKLMGLDKKKEKK